MNNEDGFTLNSVAGRDPAQYPEQEAQAQPMRPTQWYGVFDGMGGEQCGEAVSRDVALTRACVSVGRSEDAHIFIESNLMSQYAPQGVFLFEAGAWSYVDLGSVNGTYVNGVLLTAQSGGQSARVPLHDGSVLDVDAAPCCWACACACTRARITPIAFRRAPRC